jgi:hypothetical protein
VALTRFRNTLNYARLEVRMLTRTLCLPPYLPPALLAFHGGPRPGWLKEILVYLPGLQTLMVSKVPFFDHNAMAALKAPDKHGRAPISTRTYGIRVLLAEREPNTTAQGLSTTLLRFPDLVYLDLSYTKPARYPSVLSALSQLGNLQVLKLRGIGLKDDDIEFLANAVGIRVRFLDLRNNALTDVAVRSLLQASFLPRESSPAVQDTGDMSDAVSRSALSSSIANFVRRPDLDEQFVKLLSRPLVLGRSWIEELPHVGITHLFIADNQLTVKGAASLLESATLHALDIGTVDTASSTPRGPGAERLIPILGTSAKDNLTYLRAHHAVITAGAPLKDCSQLVRDSVSPGCDISGTSAKMADFMRQCSSPIPMDDPRGQKIQDLLARRPQNRTIPLRYGRGTHCCRLHPSNVPHLETLILTDVPSHIPADSPVLDHLIRFITACSNEALLATLQAKTDYSLPPGRLRHQAERQRAQSLFALRRLVLEITPVSTSTKLSSWKQAVSQNGNPDMGDQDVDNLCLAGMEDFSFFAEPESGFPEDDAETSLPMAALNEVSLMSDDELNASQLSNPGPQTEVAEIDLVAGLSAFRCRKKAEYEKLRQDQTSYTSAPGMSAEALSLPMAHFVEGHWEGEVSIIRNPAPE